MRGLTVEYYTLRGIVRAVDSVDLELDRGEWLSIVGESGSGKSTLAHAIIGLVPPPGRIKEGSVLFNGLDLVKARLNDIREIRGKEIGMVFQDPMASLDPLRPVLSQVMEVPLEHGVTDEEEARRMAVKALERVGIPRELHLNYPHQLSGGQRQRVAIAIASVMEPKLLIADEPTTALDVVVQRSILELLDSFRREGRSIMLITHDIALAAEWSDKIAVMYAGEVVEYGDARTVIEEPSHPYTQLLVLSTPDVWGEKRIRYIPGDPPDLVSPPSGCRFHPRCPFATQKCSAERPLARPLNRVRVSCHYAGLVRAS